MPTLTIDELLRENQDLRNRLDEAEQALRAIRAGEVDAVFIEAEQEQVYTLEAADNPYRLLVARVPQAAFILTADGSIICCNRRFADLLGLPSASVQGRAIADFVAPESRATLDALLRDGLTGEAQDAVTLLRDDETPAAIYLGVGPLREGAFGLCLMVTDLTEQRHYEELGRAQEALRTSEERLANELAAARRLQEFSTRLIQEGDVDHLYSQFLDAASAIMRSDFATMQIVDRVDGPLRLLAERGFDDSFSESSRFIPVDGTTVCAITRRCGRRVIAEDLQTFEGVAGTPSGEALLRAGVRAVQSTPLLSRAGDLLGMISTCWRTPHQPDEADLRQLDVLARQAADIIERRRAEQALRDADRKKDEFVATLAHELRNPLAPIRNAVQLLIAKGPSEPELDWARAVIDRQAQIMGRLLDDLLDVSRMSRNDLDLRKSRVDLAAVVESALETSRPVVEAGRHQLTVALPREPIRLTADAVRLAQVFANLLNNAAKYTPEGGHIRLSAERQGNDVTVSVQDSGIGIAADMLPSVFEIFSQAKSAQTQSQGGLGIGLSLVKWLVELHGGSIEARSSGPGQGSEFIVRLPVAADSSVAETEPPKDDCSPPPVHKRRILIVDDNRDSADSMAMLLQALGHEVGTAYDGMQAIEAATALRPDVALLDIGMPHLDGYEAGRRIRQHPSCRNVLLIAMTGWGQDEDRRRTDEAGFDHHVVKPVDPGELMKLLAALPTDRRRRTED
jgi:PAS domain S-box-containing protein